MPKLTDKLSAVNMLELSDKINQEKNVEDMRLYITVCLYHTLQKKDMSENEISTLLESLMNTAEIEVLK
jgi:uncharacterized pyridoxal phosphate-containing UPF0001 family protein